MGFELNKEGKGSLRSKSGVAQHFAIASRSWWWLARTFHGPSKRVLVNDNILIAYRRLQCRSGVRWRKAISHLNREAALRSAIRPRRDFRRTCARASTSLSPCNKRQNRTAAALCTRSVQNALLLKTSAFAFLFVNRRWLPFELRVLRISSIGSALSFCLFLFKSSRFSTRLISLRYFTASKVYRVSSIRQYL